MSEENYHIITQKALTYPQPTQNDIPARSELTKQLENPPTIYDFENEKHQIHHGGMKQMETSAEMGQSQQFQDAPLRQRLEISSDLRQLQCQHNVDLEDRQLQIEISLSHDNMNNVEHTFDSKNHLQEGQLRKNLDKSPSSQQPYANKEQNTQILEHNSQKISEECVRPTKDKPVPHEFMQMSFQEQSSSAHYNHRIKSTGMPVIEEQSQSISKFQTLSQNHNPPETMKMQHESVMENASKSSKDFVLASFEQEKSGKQLRGPASEPLPPHQVGKQGRIQDIQHIALQINPLRQMPTEEQKCVVKTQRSCDCQIM